MTPVPTNKAAALRVRIPLGVKNALRNVESVLRNIESCVYSLLPKRQLLTIVVPCYNVALYVDAFFESVMKQTNGIRDLEIICVNDGSTDDTLEKLEQWAARRPKNIRIISQKNGGLSAARNVGLAAAKGVWVNFPDPDDFWGKTYMQNVRRALRARHVAPLLAVCTKWIFYFEDTDIISDAHPLTWRFSQPITNRTTSNMGKFMHLAANACWMRREDIQKHNLTFDGHGWGSFEDAHMINRLFMLEQNRTVTFVEAAHYFYRKRQNATSLVDTAKSKKSYWLSQMEDGYLDLIKMGQKLYGTAPLYVQRTILYEMMWRLRAATAAPHKLHEVLTPQEFKRSQDLYREILQGIDVSTITDFELARCYEEQRTGLAATFKNEHLPRLRVYLKSHDPKAGTFRFFWYAGPNDDVTPDAYVNGHLIKAPITGARQAHFYDEVFYIQNFVDVPMKLGDIIEWHRDGVEIETRVGGRKLSNPLEWLDAMRQLTPSKPSKNALIKDPEAQRLRDLITSKEAQQKYRGCWILMDADMRADDNAEHLYRYLMKEGAAKNTYFVLERSSKDWQRLEQEGFQMLEMRSEDHIVAQFNASLLVSSHADHYVSWPVEPHLFRDLAKWKIIFLQHGIIKDDLSEWLNYKELDVFVTSSKAEYDSIAGPTSPYKYTPKEVQLTGLPRHDALLTLAKATTPDAILIMPTWRRYLTDETKRNGNARKPVEDFLQSDFAKQWSAVLTSEKLRDAANKHGKEIVFAPHPNMAMYLGDLNVPQWVTSIDVRNGANYQSLMARCAVMVTDYSSLAFEAAYIERSVTYFQFDAEQFFSGKHVYKHGYFRYEDDGVGPVCTTLDEIIDAICDTLENGPQEIYQNRASNFCEYRDGKCCQRMHEVMKSICVSP